MNCPQCNGQCYRDGVDDGTDNGQWVCEDCGWFEDWTPEWQQDYDVDQAMPDTVQDGPADCPKCGGTGIMEGDKSAPAASIRRHDVACPECQDI